MDLTPEYEEIEIPSDEIVIRWKEPHLSILQDYHQNISNYFPNFLRFPLKPPILRCTNKFEIFQSPVMVTSAKTAASFAQNIRELFMVPKPMKFHQSKNRVIKKYQLVEAFLSFLVRLLCYKIASFDPLNDRNHKFIKELRFLHTILGDKSLMVYDDVENEEFQNLLEEFEAVANEAGSLVHSLLFSIDTECEKLDEGIDVVLNSINILKADILRFLIRLPSISISAYITPKISVVDSVLIVDSLISDLDDLMNREDDSNIADVKDQIKTLHQGLILLQSSMKAIGLQQPSEIGELKAPLMQIADMANQAEYLIVSFLVGVVPRWYLIKRLPDINHKIELIGIELQEFSKKYEFGGFAKYFSAQPSLRVKRDLEVDKIIVGFEEEATDILHQLVGGTECLQVISIYGMPGIGKTTFAKKLYNHPSVNHLFDKLSWCVVSQTYQRQSTLANILIHIAIEFDKDRILEMEEESLVEHIYKTLKRRRYLIVMDDLWDSNVWDDLWRCFPDDGNGSRILFTTRSKDVAPPNSTILALPSLSDDQCWELLEKKVFRNKSCPPELIGVGEKIASNCCGLPLTVVIVAGILSAMDEEKGAWEEVGGNLASYIHGDNSVMQILELSYKHLPQHLKPCFLYLGAFREDEEIPTRELMRLWIAEGFVHKEEAKSAENIAEEYLMELIDKSLVMVAKRSSDGGVKACAIHDLLHEFCFKRCEEENFQKFVKSDCCSIYERFHRLQELDEHRLTTIYCQHIRSSRGRSFTSPFYVCDMRLLRVLHFNYIDSPHDGIEYLVCLKYLVVKDLPASIVWLVNLEYLRVESYFGVDLSAEIMNMKKLRYIHVNSEANYDSTDCNNFHANKLEFLSGVNIWGLKDEKILKCSAHLRKLKLSTCKHVDLNSFAQLESLNINYFMVSYMKGIRFPSNIKKLTLANAELTRKKMSIIGRLENLEVLKLRSISFENERWDTRDGEFQNLRFLKLHQIEHLTEWNVDSSGHFPMLQQLVLSNCLKLLEIPSEIGEIPPLQLIEVKGYVTRSLEESAIRIQEDQRDMGNEELRIIILPIFQFLQKMFGAPNK